MREFKKSGLFPKNALGWTELGATKDLGGGGGGAPASADISRS